MKRDTRLYNMILPIWLLLRFPLYWLTVLPVNFLIDSAVLLLALKALNKKPLFKTYIATIFKVWIFGFLADFVGIGILLLMFPMDNIFKGDLWINIINSVCNNPFSNGFGLVLVTIAVAISGVCIYFINLKLSFLNLNMEKKEKKKLALIIAICTAPYFFYFPTELLIKL